MVDTGDRALNRHAPAADVQDREGAGPLLRSVIMLVVPRIADIILPTAVPPLPVAPMLVSPMPWEDGLPAAAGPPDIIPGSDVSG